MKQPRRFADMGGYGIAIGCCVGESCGASEVGGPGLDDEEHGVYARGFHPTRCHCREERLDMTRFLVISWTDHGYGQSGSGKGPSERIVGQG